MFALVINESVAHEFQRRYLEGERGGMAGLYAECRAITAVLAKAYASRHESGHVDVDDLVQVIVSRVLSRYRNPGYSIHSFAKVLNIEVVHELSNHKGPKAQLLKSVVPLSSIPEPSSPQNVPVLGVDPLHAFNEIAAWGLVGARIILILHRSRTYRGAILDIEPIAGRQWIYDHGDQLHYVWRHLRRGKAKRAGEHRRRHPGRDGQADRGHQRLPLKGRQAEPLDGHREDAGAVEQDR